MSVFITLCCPSTAVIGSFSGTSATGAAWSAAAISSSVICEPERVLAAVLSQNWYGVQPSAGSMNLLTRALSLPLLIADAPARAATLAAESCAVWPLAVSRYVLTTLSLWSWSTTSNPRTVGQAWPSEPVPSAGILSRPWAMSRWAAR